MRAATRTALVALAVAASLVAADARALVWPDVPERIERGLASSDVAARRAAARDLATLSADRATPLVLRALEDPDDAVKTAAADAAIRVRVGEATRATAAWLAGGATPLRVEACRVAGALPDSRVVTQLSRALGDAEATVRTAAAEALGAYAGVGDAVPPLVGKLDDASPVVRVAVATSLAKLGDARAVVPLEGKVQDSVPEVRQAVARALGELGDARAAASLVGALRDNTADVRVAAIAAIGKLRADSAVDALAPLADDRNPSIRQSAIAALGRIGSPAAVRALVAKLGKDDDSPDAAGGGAVERTPVRDALVAVGPSCASDVAAVLDGASPAAAASAAWVLGALHAHDCEGAIVAAMRRGTVPAPAALRALAGAGTSATLPVVLEFAGDASRVVRDAALDATGALLDPASPDGRAVEPLRDALERSARLSSDERATLARLLGRTGASRAAPVLAGLARAGGDPDVRLAAIDALGTLGPAAVARAEDLAPLLDAIDDADAVVRMHAAVALAAAGDARARDALVAKLGAPEADRRAVLEALSGVLARDARGPSDDASVASLVRALDLAAGEERDAIAVALARAPSRGAMDALDRLAASDDPDDRRTAATLLAARAGEDAPRAVAIARKLATDGDASVRAQAAWSLGALADRASAASLVPLLRADADVAIDASTALARVAARAKDAPLATPICASLGDARPLVRAAALAALSIAHARCSDGARERELLDRDPDDAVRASAALAVTRTSLGDADARALAKCVASDRSGDVASRCRAPRPIPAASRAVDVYVVPDRAESPVAHAPYVLSLADGTLHAGTSDRRGAVFDPHAPDGEVALLRPR